MDCCDAMLVAADSRFGGAATCDDGGGVSDEGIIVVLLLSLVSSSFNSVLKELEGSTGDPGPSVEGRVTCDMVM